jgi:dUTP pyrophosphatase
MGNYPFGNFLNIRRVGANAIIPTRVHEADAGLDLYAAEDIYIPIGTVGHVPTGVAIQVPLGYVGKIEDRSSLASAGFQVVGGVIDAGYDGEVIVILHNFQAKTVSTLSFDPSVPPGYLIKAGQRVAQMLLYKVEHPEVRAVTFKWGTDRMTSGFGDSGL